ncbi:MAG: hypothetical protein AAF193_07930, partial [Bacteroidota bacterium]
MRSLKLGFGMVVMSAILFGACTTDVELNAPYDSETVVFGLLDPGLDTQWVKVNRTWLGDGDNTLIAQIQDSSEYADDAFTGVINHVVDGNVVDTYELQTAILDNKEINGIFFGPEYKAYYITTPGGLDVEGRYDLDLDFVSKEDVNGTTELIASFALRRVETPTVFSKEGTPSEEKNLILSATYSIECFLKLIVAKFDLG